MFQPVDVVIKFLRATVTLLETAALKLRVVALEELLVAGADGLDERGAADTDDGTAIQIPMLAGVLACHVGVYAVHLHVYGGRPTLRAFSTRFLRETWWDLSLFGGRLNWENVWGFVRVGELEGRAQGRNDVSLFRRWVPTLQLAKR